MVFSAVLPLAACGIDVQDAEQGKKVDIKSPFGSVNVRTDVENPDTGLSGVSGAQPLREHDDHESADVNISSPWFGVKVVGRHLRERRRPGEGPRILQIRMKTFGAVTECRGDVDFRGGGRQRRPVCKEKPSSHDVQLLTGTEERQRVVSVIASRRRFRNALVYVNTRG